MKKLTLTLVAAAALVLPLAGTAMAQTKTIVGDTQVVTASIESIERSTRAVTLKKDNGEYVTITVPSDVAKFDAMKVGDKITVSGWRARDGGAWGHSREITLPNGEKMMFGPPAGTGDGGGSPAVDVR